MMRTERQKSVNPDDYYEKLLQTCAASEKLVTITMKSGAVRRGVVVNATHGMACLISIDGTGAHDGGGAHHVRIESIEVVSAEIDANHPKMKQIKRSLR